MLLTCIYATKETTKRNRKSKQSVPQIECAIKAAKIINPEFMAKCPLGCQDVKYRVYGTDIYASFSSVCAAAIHSGIIDNSGGKILVQKLLVSLGTRVVFPMESATFITTMEGILHTFRKFITERISDICCSITSYTWCHSYIQTLYDHNRICQHNSKDSHHFDHHCTDDLHQSDNCYSGKASHCSAQGSSNVHPVYSAVAAAAVSRQVQAAQGRTQNQATETDAWKSGSSLSDPGFNSKEDIVPKTLKPVSQGNPNCKVDLAFLIDGSWSIGRRRFQIQKQFLKDVSQALDVGPIGPLMGIVQYGDEPSTEFNLKAYANTKDLKNAIEKISQKGGLSNVGKALSFVNKNYFEDAHGNRGSAPNVAVVLVDGWPTDKVEEASRLARESGINIFFVTIEGPDENEKKNVIETNFVDKAVCRTSGYYSIHVTSWFTLYKVVQPLVKRVCDVDRLACSKTCLNSADIGFVIDGSSSVGTGNFRTILQFVANISKEFEISDTDTRIGAVQYTYEQRLEFDFNKHSTKQEVLNAIKRINYWSGGTSTGAAINFAFEQLFSKSKPNKRKIMILITDGRSYDDVRGPALAAHQNGVIAYSIGIAWAAQDELEAVATDPDKEHSFFVDEFDRLYRFVPKIVQNICTEFNSQPRN
ncbi:hypothetical protein E2320_018798 [Naja naja]|nr:hypothetical protein E2320_018798 [Naja naja]